MTPISKQLDLRELKVRQDFIKNSKYTVEYIKSADNIADFFTKLVPYPLFAKFRPKLITNHPTVK